MQGIHREQERSYQRRYQDPPSHSRIILLEDSYQELSESGVGSSIQKDAELSRILNDKFNQSITDTTGRSRHGGRRGGTGMDRSVLLHKGGLDADGRHSPQKSDANPAAGGISKFMLDQSQESSLVMSKVPGSAGVNPKWDDSSQLIRVSAGSESKQQSPMLADDQNINDLTGLLGQNPVEQSTDLNDLTDLNNATGLERLSEGNSRVLGDRTLDFDKSAMESDQ